MKNIVKIAWKLFKISFITFVVTYIFSGLLPYIYVFKDPHHHSERIGALLPLFVYLFIYLFWIFFEVSFLYVSISIKAKLNRAIRYCFAVALCVLVALFGFNFDHLIDKDYDKITIWMPYVYILFLISGLSLALLTEKFFKDKIGQY